MTRTSNFSTSFEISEPVKEVVRNMGIRETLSPGGGRQGPRLVPSSSAVYTGTPDPSFSPELRGPPLLTEPSAILQSCQPDHRAFFWQHSDIQGNISDIKLNMSLWAKLALWNFNKHSSNALISQPAQVQTKTPNTDKVSLLRPPRFPLCYPSWAGKRCEGSMQLLAGRIVPFASSSRV